MTSFWLGRLLLSGLLSAGRYKEARALVRRQGFISRVLWAGPFENEGDGGFDRIYGPEKADGLELNRRFGSGGHDMVDEP